VSRFQVPVLRFSASSVKPQDLSVFIRLSGEDTESYLVGFNGLVTDDDELYCPRFFVGRYEQVSWCYSARASNGGVGRFTVEISLGIASSLSEIAIPSGQALRPRAGQAGYLNIPSFCYLPMLPQLPYLIVG